jgi:hypothetical protein
MLRRFLLPLGYLAVAIVIVGVTVSLVAYGRGYSYDFTNNRWVVNGLVLVSSFPSGADVKVNGKNLHHKTPYRATLEAGDYNFEVVKAGYRSWSKRLTIVASGVTWAQYVLLFPPELHPQ